VSQPSRIHTARLVLRPPERSDAPAIQRLANDVDVARNTLTIPHPYPPGMAESWIAMVTERWADGSHAAFAICDRMSGELCGVIGLRIERDQERAELGYWIGKPFRGRGLASEAARALLDHAFSALELERVYASHFPWNPASGRVLEKAGLKREGTLRGHVHKNGERVDLHFFGILRAEHAAAAGRRKQERT
jgi:RimJ/RimL family protein N-acetyltransferase